MNKTTNKNTTDKHKHAPAADDPSWPQMIAAPLRLNAAQIHEQNNKHKHTSTAQYKLYQATMTMVITKTRHVI